MHWRVRLLGRRAHHAPEYGAIVEAVGVVEIRAIVHDAKHEKDAKCCERGEQQELPKLRCRRACKCVAVPRRELDSVIPGETDDSLHIRTTSPGKLLGTTGEEMFKA